MSWADYALCAGADPEDWDLTASERQRLHAVAICAQCPVNAQCLEDAQRNPPYGMIQAGFGWRGSAEPVDAVVVDRRKRKRVPAPKLVEPTHGYGGYGRGCRCEVCVSARAKRRAQYAASAKRKRDSERLALARSVSA